MTDKKLIPRVGDQVLDGLPEGWKHSRPVKGLRVRDGIVVPYRPHRKGAGSEIITGSIVDWEVFVRIRGPEGDAVAAMREMEGAE